MDCACLSGWLVLDGCVWLVGRFAESVGLVLASQRTNELLQQVDKLMYSVGSPERPADN